MTALRDDPRVTPFRHVNTVHFDELDPLGILHNARYALHVERATTAFLRGHGFRWAADTADNPDQFQVVRRFEIDFELPFIGTGPLAVELSATHIGTTSLRYRFRCVGPSGESHAHGSRSVVKLDPDTFRPEPWTARWRAAHLTVLERADGTT
ncbi:hotdog domain-containing protein [Actinokineospora auranticolor]|uniref:Acyl-CoA thioester hydrolase n=1 Tax=Actinokineospora auranticolor TaxID=155976 RepID=A0A2S6GFD8_9PSEU|nr:hotdog domain-containing protein [Actinokineospora auranticolor]PPK63927.1 acyl-CoA thioester hydrolase [Actinokineospora auranticolor]